MSTTRAAPIESTIHRLLEAEVHSITSSKQSPEYKLEKLTQAIQGVDEKKVGLIKHDLLLNLMDCMDMQLLEDAKTKI
mgnify:CR=1 FL=1